MNLPFNQISNRKISQAFLIAIILLLIYVAIVGLKYFLSGFLGAITLYILYRNKYFELTEKRGMKKSLASTLMIIFSLVVVAIPLWLIIDYMIPQIKQLLNNRELITTKFNQVKDFMASKPILENIDLSEQNLTQWMQKGVTYVPKFLGSIASVLTNIVVALFVLYFMQVNARYMEKKVNLMIPYSAKSKKELWAESYKMIRSNTIGIPLMALCQAIVAIIGYYIFGVNNAVLWGLITGAATIIPVVGTMIVWVPVCIVLMAGGEVMNGLWLALYCLVVVGGTDNILRFTILKKLGDVPPLITVFGVILGLNLFGMMGLIFGPLILSIIDVLISVYRNEFGRRHKLLINIKEKKKTLFERLTAKKEQP